MRETTNAAVALVRELGLWLADDIGAIDEAYARGILTEAEHWMCRVLVVLPVRFR